MKVPEPDIVYHVPRDRRAILKERRPGVYMVTISGLPLYVGTTKMVKSRIYVMITGAHPRVGFLGKLWLRFKVSFWFREVYTERMALERYMIRTVRPTLNIKNNPDYA